MPTNTLAYCAPATAWSTLTVGISAARPCTSRSTPASLPSNRSLGRALGARESGSSKIIARGRSSDWAGSMRGGQIRGEKPIVLLYHVRFQAVLAASCVPGAAGSKTAQGCRARQEAEARDDTDAGLFQRDVQTGIVVHGCLPFLIHEAENRPRSSIGSGDSHHAPPSPV